MIAKIQSDLSCDVKTMWNEILKPSSLQYVSSPILNFIPEDKNAFSKQWREGITYQLKLYMLNLFPLGRHIILIEKIDRDNNILATRENGTLTTVWNHIIRFFSVDEQTIHYIDEVEIRAGMLTFPIWIFAHIFYRHRQKRWKKLLKLRESLT